MTDDTRIVPMDEPVPEYPAEYAGEGLDAAGEPTVQMSRIKIIQAMTDAELKDQHGEGAAVVMPDGLLLAAPGDRVTAHLIFLWQSFSKWRDTSDSPESPIVEETTDPTSALAKRCLDWRNRTEPYGDGTKREYRYVHAFNGYVWLPDVKMAAITSWSRGSHKIGRQLHQRITATRAPVYASVLTLWTERTKNKAGQPYWVLRWDAAGLVAPSDLDPWQQVYRQIRAAYDAANLSTPPDSDEAAST